MKQALVENFFYFLVRVSVKPREYWVPFLQMLFQYHSRFVGVKSLVVSKVSEEMSENETTGIKRPNVFASNVAVENIIEPKKRRETQNGLVN